MKECLKRHLVAFLLNYTPRLCIFKPAGQFDWDETLSGIQDMWHGARSCLSLWWQPHLFELLSLGANVALFYSLIH